MNYLVVNKWHGAQLISQAPHLQHLIRRVACQGKKAQAMGKVYQEQLNNGKTMEQCVLGNLEWYSVTSIPDGQAREYTNYLDWEECPIFEG